MNQDYKEDIQQFSKKEIIHFLKENPTVQLVEKIITILILISMILSSILIFMLRRSSSELDLNRKIFAAFLVISFFLIFYSFVRNAILDKKSRFNLPWILIIILSVISTSLAISFLLVTRFMAGDCPFD